MSCLHLYFNVCKLTNWKPPAYFISVSLVDNPTRPISDNQHDASAISLLPSLGQSDEWLGSSVAWMQAFC